MPFEWSQNPAKTDRFRPFVEDIFWGPKTAENDPFPKENNEFPNQKLWIFKTKTLKFSTIEKTLQSLSRSTTIQSTLKQTITTNNDNNNSNNNNNVNIF